MASTITPQSLTVTISESIVLNGQPINSENQLVIADVNEYSKRIMSVPTASEVTLVAFGASVAAGQFVMGDLKYLRITNKDSVNYARIRVKKNSSETLDMRLDAGKSFMMGNTKESVSASGAAFSAFQDADSISAQAYTAAIDVEFVVASI